MKRLKAIGAFWYDFVIGDDWRVAAVEVVAEAATALLFHAASRERLVAAARERLRRPRLVPPPRHRQTRPLRHAQASTLSTRVPSGVSRTPGWLPVVP